MAQLLHVYCMRYLNSPCPSKGCIHGLSFSKNTTGALLLFYCLSKSVTLDLTLKCSHTFTTDISDSIFQWLPTLPLRFAVFHRVSFAVQCPITVKAASHHHKCSSRWCCLRSWVCKHYAGIKATDFFFFEFLAYPMSKQVALVMWAVYPKVHCSVDGEKAPFSEPLHLANKINQLQICSSPHWCWS